MYALALGRHAYISGNVAVLQLLHVTRSWKTYLLGTSKPRIIMKHYCAKPLELNDWGKSDLVPD